MKLTLRQKHATITMTGIAALTAVEPDEWEIDPGDEFAVTITRHLDFTGEDDASPRESHSEASSWTTNRYQGPPIRLAAGRPSEDVSEDGH